MTDSPTQSNTETSETDPYGTWSDKEIDVERIEEDIVGTHTFDAPLYHPNRMDEQAPSGYRENTDDGVRFPPEDVIAALVTDENEELNKEMVALMPTTEQMVAWQDEFEAGERETCPAVVFEPFYCERVVGSKPLSVAYELLVSESGVYDECPYEYSWEADYYNWEVTITVTRKTDEKSSE